MSKSRFLPDELRSRIIDSIANGFDILHENTAPKYRAAMVSDAWTDTKLIKQLEIFHVWLTSSSIVERVGIMVTKEKLLAAINLLKDEVADYLLLEEIQNAKQKSTRD